VTPAAGQTGSATVTVTVSDPDGLSASTSFEVSVSATAPAGSLSGTVTTEATGLPLADVLVGVYGADDGLFPSTWAVTGEEGTYTVPGLDGAYKVVFVPPSATGLRATWHDGADTRAEATVHTVTTTTGVSGIDAGLGAAATISGTVTDPDGAPLAGAVVRAVAPTDTWFPSGTATTAADGSYAITGLPAGTYQVAFGAPAGSTLRSEWHDDAPDRTAATSFTLSTGDALAGIDAQLGQGTAVTGTVTTTDGPLAGAVVALYAPGAYVPTATATTGADGTYTANGLATGTYRVRFAAAGHTTRWWDDAPTRATATDLTIDDGTLTTAVDATLLPIP
jgi:hypothetical protein